MFVRPSPASSGQVPPPLSGLYKGRCFVSPVELGPIFFIIMWAHLLLAVLACALLPGEAVTPSEDITCHQDSVAAAANFAVHHIDEHHQHGYKFKLGQIRGHNYEQTADGCNIDLQLMLQETKCHFTDAKPVENCEAFDMSQRGAVADCAVMLSVRASGTTVTSHQCTTKQTHSNEEMAMMCPDCPVMLPLNDPDAVKAVQKAVKKYNLESNNQHYFALLEVGRVLSSYIPSSGMMTYPKFVLVETNCPRNSRIAPEACTPRCPHRAQHAVCSTTYSLSGVSPPGCELFPAKNSTPLGPGEVEPQCGPSFHHRHEADTCSSQITDNDPALHHICPFPLPAELPHQEAV
nr:alpha-2-HS-glycoprotein-like [Nerophis lumbriciformis]